MLYYKQREIGGIMATGQKKNRRTAKQLRLIDDDFLRLYFNDNPDGVRFILSVILQRNDLKVIHSETQSEYRSLAGHSITLDIYAEDQLGKKYNIGVQRSDAGASPKRARFHSNILDTKLLKKSLTCFPRHLSYSSLKMM